MRLRVGPPKSRVVTRWAAAAPGIKTSSGRWNLKNVEKSWNFLKWKYESKKWSENYNSNFNRHKSNPQGKNNWHSAKMISEKFFDTTPHFFRGASNLNVLERLWFFSPSFILANINLIKIVTVFLQIFKTEGKLLSWFFVSKMSYLITAWHWELDLRNLRQWPAEQQLRRV